MLESQGKTVEEAIQSGLRDLSLSKEYADIAILDEGSKGFLGIGARPARVLITEKLKSQIEAQRKQEEADRKEALEREKRAAREAKEAQQREEKARRDAQQAALREKQRQEREAREALAAKERESRPPREPAKKPATEKPEAQKPAPAQRPAQPVAQRPSQESTPGKREESDRPRRQDGGRGRGPRPPRAQQQPRQRPPRTEQRPLTPEEAAVLTKEATAYFSEIVSHMDVHVEVTSQISDGALRIEASGPDAGTLIGYRGETLDALQYLVSLKVNRGEEGYQRVTLDAENYRAKREETLIKLANRLAGKASKTGKKVTLEPMNPYERRILHSALQGNNNVRTHSEGEEPYRKVVITPRREHNRTDHARADHQNRERDRNTAE